MSVTPTTTTTENHYMRTQRRTTTALLALIALVALTACEEDRAPVDTSPMGVAQRVLDRDDPVRLCEKAGGVYRLTDGTCSTGTDTYQLALCRQLDLLGYGSEYRFNRATRLCEKR